MTRMELKRRNRGVDKYNHSSILTLLRDGCKLVAVDVIKSITKLLKAGRNMLLQSFSIDFTSTFINSISLIISYTEISKTH